jgi:ribose-phosphate pyrophosphokinase
MIRIGEIVVDQGRFPDNTLLMKIPQNIGDQKQAIIWNYEDDSELFALICIRKYFQNVPLILYMPYCPHARQDRVKNPEDVFTLKYFCDVINDLKFSQVVIEDPHSNVCTALLDNVIVIEAKCHIDKVIEELADENLVMCYPDEGAMKRYSGMVNKPYTFGVKKRAWEDGKILGLDFMNPEVVKGKNVLIVDDICSRGGTFYHTAKALKDAGAEKIYLYVTHCEMTIFNGDIFNSGLIDHVYTTNSIFPANAANENISIVG